MLEGGEGTSQVNKVSRGTGMGKRPPASGNMALWRNWNVFCCVKEPHIRMKPVERD